MMLLSCGIDIPESCPNTGVNVFKNFISITFKAVREGIPDTCSPNLPKLEKKCHLNTMNHSFFPAINF